MKKKVLFAAAFMLATVGAYAQGNGIAGITEATNMVTSYFDPGTKLIYAVGAVVGLIRSSLRATPIPRRPQPLGSVPVSSSL